MYVYVTVTELQGASSLQDLGELPEQTALEQIRNWVLSRVEHELSQLTRVDPRHFWHNDQIRRVGDLLSDLDSPGRSVALELRPDVYCVSLPGQANRAFLYDPERLPGAFIQLLLAGHHAGPCCYELRLPDGAPLNGIEDLISQAALPHAEVLNQRNPAADLLLRRRPVYVTTVTSAVVIAAAAGLVLGYLSGWLG